MLAGQVKVSYASLSRGSSALYSSTDSAGPMVVGVRMRSNRLNASSNCDIILCLTSLALSYCSLPLHSGERLDPCFKQHTDSESTVYTDCTKITSAKK